MLGLFVLLMTSLYLLNDASQNATQFSRIYIGLLLLNSVFLLTLLVIIGLNLLELVHQVLEKRPGSRLTLRLVFVFVLLTLAPAATVYFFSVQLLSRGIDSWFDVSVERALNDALDLSRSSLDLHMRQIRQQGTPMASAVSEVSNAVAALTLSDMLSSSDAVEMTLFGNNARIIATSGDITASMVPRLPGEAVLRLVSHGDTYIGLDPIKDSGLHIRLVVPVPATRENPESRILQVLYPLSGRIDRLADSVQSAFGKYNELVYLRTPLKQSFILTLSLVLLLAVLFAVWAALFSARKLIAPISELAEGTEAVAAGEYHTRVPEGRKDDLGLLVRSFNRMTQRLGEARDAAENSQRLLERQRAYLQTVLQHLSSGVLSLDTNLILRTVNAAANQILELDLTQYQGRSLGALGKEHPILARFYESIEPHLKAEEDEWQEQLVLLLGASGRKVLMCRGALLPGQHDLPRGHVVVFDDVTTLIQAQRDAAWAEVARRLAHEIKNPLTPIQLSAERLQRKLRPKLGDTESGVLDRSTRTIVQQVESMKTMVNAFGEYARTPAMDIVVLDLNRLIRDVVELYRANPLRARLELALEERLPCIEADAVRIRQLLHNLIKNALEALDGRKRGELSIRTRCVEDTRCRFVELVVTDNGPGFPQAMMDQLFEPYVTSKTKGNGLGLAIVKKIVEEHGARVWVENPNAGGACVRVRFLSQAAKTARHDERIEGDAA